MDTIKRFWSKIDIKTPNDCWEWKAGKYTNGYGRFYMNKKQCLAHRISFILSGGILTKEKSDVLHYCDNPACCNPSHLFAGDQKDNILDMWHKKRGNSSRGINHYKTKLTEEQVIEIRKLQYKMKIIDIAILYNISIGTVYNIHHKITWKHI